MLDAVVKIYDVSRLAELWQRLWCKILSSVAYISTQRLSTLAPKSFEMGWDSDAVMDAHQDPCARARAETPHESP